MCFIRDIMIPVGQTFSAVRAILSALPPNMILRSRSHTFVLRIIFTQVLL